MAGITLGPKLRQEYEQLFQSCKIRPEKASQVAAIVGQITPEQARYQAVGAQLKVPWFVVAVLHNMESSLSFQRHLHNGDPLTARTVQVPKGHPKQGNPPFTWEASAADALSLRKLHQWSDWSVAGTLYTLEGYNGWGYRLHHPQVRSPYLWSYSGHYVSGKYVKDGIWSNSAVSQQCGAAVLLRRMLELGLISIPAAAAPAPATAATPAGVASLPLLHYSATEIPHGRELQEFLNRLPGVFLKVDGRPGERTSDAFKQVTGRYLPGDPRG